MIKDIRNGFSQRTNRKFLYSMEKIGYLKHETIELIEILSEIQNNE